MALTISTVKIVLKRDQNLKILLCSNTFWQACDGGHIDDFPWNRFVRHKAGCKESDLRLIDLGAGIDKVFVRCETCKSQRSLKDAFNRSGFINPPIACSCKSPWLGLIHLEMIKDVIGLSEHFNVDLQVYISQILKVQLVSLLGQV